MTCLFVYFSADVRAQLILREVTTTSFSATKERKTRRLSFPAKMKLKIVKNQLMTKKKWKVNVELWKTWMKIVKENEEKPFGVSSSIEVKWRFWRRFYSFLDQVRRNVFFIFQSKKKWVENFPKNRVWFSWQENKNSPFWLQFHSLGTRCWW